MYTELDSHLVYTKLSALWNTTAELKQFQSCIDWHTFILHLDIGVIAVVDRYSNIITDRYIIQDAKKYMLAKLKYGI